MSDIVTGLGHGPNLRDWQHANKLFVGNNYALKPKDSYLFHVAFDLNPIISNLTTQKIIEAGLLVKSVQIPKYTIDAKTLNAYNRPNIVQQKIKYDPIQITFHDDSSDVIRNFWYDYMSHYYRDTDYATRLSPTTSYEAPHRYNKPTKNFWGYQPAKYDRNSERLISSIKIYSLYQKKFSEYILINPIITSFAHGQHEQGKHDFMEHTMSIAYETVIYNYGTVKTENEPAGFAGLNYDKGPSPLSPQGGGTNSILGPGGLVSAVTGISDTLTPQYDDAGNPVVSSGSIAKAGLTAFRAFNNIKGQNLLGMAGTELQNIAGGILSGDTNTLNRLSLPKAGPSSGSLSVQQPIQE